MARKIWNKPNLLVFDLDNTLYEYEPCHRAGEEAFFKYAMEILGIPHKIARRRLATARKNVKIRVTGASSHERALYFSEFLALHNTSIDPRFILEAENHYWSNFLAKMELAPYCEEVLVKARLNRIMVALVTNLTSIVQYRKLVHLGIDNYFDIIVTSQETMGEKDTFEPFSLMMNRLKNKVIEEVWFFGDTNSDFPDTYNARTKVFFSSPFAKKPALKKDVLNLQSYKEIAKLLG